LVNYPFSQEDIDKNVFIRHFSSDVDPNELKWHIDMEDRLVQVIENEDWHFQFDNELPVLIKDDLFIPAGIWHRIIKGNGDLKLRVTKSISFDDI